MDLQGFQQFCLSFNGVTEEFPFDESTLVYKVSGKIFALSNVENFDFISLKCDPDDALAYRAAFESVKAGYHLNKRHWNTVTLTGEVPDQLLRDWIEASYRLAAAGLSAKLRKMLNL